MAASYYHGFRPSLHVAPGKWRLFKTLSLIGCGLSLHACYLLEQGCAQVNLIARRRPLAAIQTELPPEAIARIATITNARDFAFHRYHLGTRENYQDFIALDQDAVTYVVTASAKNELRAHEWWFPIIGTVTYKGFFKRADAEAEAQTLQARNLDTRIRGARAFSLLGYLPDPIYQPMLNSDHVSLADMVIHEATHTALYLPGQTAFNEGVATFVGLCGAVQFFLETEGPGSARHQAAEANVTDQILMAEHVNDVCQKLRPKTQYLTVSKREAILREAANHFTANIAPRLKTKRFEAFRTPTITNATWIGLETYYQHLPEFARLHRALGGDLARTIAYTRDNLARTHDPCKALASASATPSAHAKPHNP